MAVQAFRVTADTTVRRIDLVDTVTRVTLAVSNRGGASVFLGGQSVTAAAGYELAAGEKFTVELRPGDLGLYAVTAGAGVRLDVMQIGWS